MRTKEIILSYTGQPLRELLSAIPDGRFGEISEIRLRVGRPVIVYINCREFFLCAKNGGENAGGSRAAAGAAASGLTGSVSAAYQATREDIAQILELISDYSIYAFEEEIRSGYITIPGGHRIGLTGRASVENRAVRALRNISGFNIRVSHQVIGCGEKVVGRLLDGPSAEKRLLNTLIISPPACGKTTLLRDLIRLLSDGIPGVFAGVTVGVADERSEIAGCYRGVPQNDVGMRTDVLDACPKAEGMSMLLRAMGPRIVAADELGGRKDAEAAEEVANAGVGLLCTAHGYGPDDLRGKPGFGPLFEQKIFKRFVVLYGAGKLGGIYDEAGRTVRGPGERTDPPAAAAYAAPFRA
ncbi:MAG: stage III sporulation protein AA [Firmicutes bacterium]|nr:stage III sporulation protein AA [Bacillota bacterium]